MTIVQGEQLADMIDAVCQNAQDLPLCNEGTRVDYTLARNAYAVNVTLLHDPKMHYDIRTGRYAPRPETTMLLVQGGPESSTPGRWGGISSYVDTVHDPAGKPDALFDPIEHVARRELSKQCDLETAAVRKLYLGQSLTQQRGRRRPRQNLHVLPVLGVHDSIGRPKIGVDDRKVAAYAWVQLNRIRRASELVPGYLAEMLPRSLGALGLDEPRIEQLLMSDGPH